MSVLRGFHALADPTRFSIVNLVRAREMRAGDIAQHFEMTRSAVSQHLTILRDAGLIAERRDGAQRFYRTEPATFSELSSALTPFVKRASKKPAKSTGRGSARKAAPARARKSAGQTTRKTASGGAKRGRRS